MLKRRGLLIGLGLGLMIGASVLQLILAAEKGSSSLSLSDSSLSVEELKQEADSQGYALIESSVKMYTQAELDAAVQKANADSQVSKDDESSASQDPKDNGSADEPSQGASEPNNADAENVSASTKEEEHTYSFYIRNNASLIEVATALQEMGVIADKDQFVKQAKPYSKNIRVGTSTFVGKPTFDKIIAEITRAKY